MFSCNRDDNSSSTTDSVVGIWKLTSYVILDGKDKKNLFSETNSGCVASNRDAVSYTHLDVYKRQS